MKETRLGRHKVEVYDNIEEMPMRRFHAFNKFMLIDSGIGSTLQDFDTHLAKARAYVATKKNEQAMTELDNLRQNYFFIMEGISPKYMAFATLVARIDGKECNDLSEDGIRKVLETIADAPISTLNETFEGVKKKIEEDLPTFFPKMFDDASVKEYYDLLKKRTIMILDGIIEGETEARTSDLIDLTLQLITFSNPGKFSGADSLEIVFEKSFDKMCHVIARYLSTNPKDYTVTEFYSAFDYVQELMKAESKQNRFKIK
jgi:hypothetical protein